MQDPPIAPNAHQRPGTRPGRLSHCVPGWTISDPDAATRTLTAVCPKTAPPPDASPHPSRALRALMQHKVTPNNPQPPKPLPAHLSTSLCSRNDQGTTRQAIKHTPAATPPPCPHHHPYHTQHNKKARLACPRITLSSLYGAWHDQLPCVTAEGKHPAPPRDRMRVPPINFGGHRWRAASPGPWMSGTVRPVHCGVPVGAPFVWRGGGGWRSWRGGVRWCSGQHRCRKRRVSGWCLQCIAAIPQDRHLCGGGRLVALEARDVWVDVLAAA